MSEYNEMPKKLENHNIPVSVRGHHITEVAAITVDYASNSPLLDENGNNIPIEELYLHPNEGSDYIDKLVDDWVKLQAGGYTDSFLGPFVKPLLDDYFGINGVNARAFMEEKARFLRQILLSDPDTLVELNTAPDAICYGCQISQQGHTGRHCLAPTESDGSYVEAMSKILDDMSIEYSRLALDSIVFKSKYLRQVGIMDALLKAGSPSYSDMMTQIENETNEYGEE